MGEILRGPDGKLLPGTASINPAGRPSRTREAEIYMMLLEIFDEPTRQAFVKAQQKRLSKGETAPWREIAKYLLPTVQRTEHTGADGEPLLPISQVIAALQELERQQQAGKQPGPDAAK